MTVSLSLKLILPAAALLCLLGSSPDWNEVDDKACGFSITMPPSPELMVDTVQVSAGSVVSRRYLAFDDVDTYTATCSVMPPTFFASIDLDAFLNDGADRFATGSGGEMIHREMTRRDGYLGIRHAVQAGELFVYSEVHIVNDRLFQLSVSKWAEAEFEKGDLGRFFGSFELTP